MAGAHQQLSIHGNVTNLWRLNSRWYISMLADDVGVPVSNLIPKYGFMVIIMVYEEIFAISSRFSLCFKRLARRLQLAS